MAIIIDKRNKKYFLTQEDLLCPVLLVIAGQPPWRLGNEEPDGQAQEADQAHADVEVLPVTVQVDNQQHHILVHRNV